MRNLDFNSSERNEKPAGGPHHDYEKNKETCRLFVSNVRSQLLKGMGLKMCNSEGLPQSLFEIYWIPPPYAKMGIYSHRVFLHQPNNSFTKELEETFSKFYQKANDFIKTQEDRGIYALDGSKTSDLHQSGHGIVVYKNNRL